MIKVGERVRVIYARPRLPDEARVRAVFADDGFAELESLVVPGKSWIHSFDHNPEALLRVRELPPGSLRVCVCPSAAPPSAVAPVVVVPAVMGAAASDTSASPDSVHHSMAKRAHASAHAQAMVEEPRRSALRAAPGRAPSSRSSRSVRWGQVYVRYLIRAVGSASCGVPEATEDERRKKDYFDWLLAVSDEFVGAPPTRSGGGDDDRADGDVRDSSPNLIYQKSPMVRAAALKPTANVPQESPLLSAATTGPSPKLSPHLSMTPSPGNASLVSLDEAPHLSLGPGASDATHNDKNTASWKGAAQRCRAEAALLAGVGVTVMSVDAFGAERGKLGSLDPGQRKSRFAEHFGLSYMETGNIAKANRECAVAADKIIDQRNRSAAGCFCRPAMDKLPRESAKELRLRLSTRGAPLPPNDASKQELIAALEADVESRGPCAGPSTPHASAHSEPQADAGEDSVENLIVAAVGGGVSPAVALQRAAALAAELASGESREISHHCPCAAEGITCSSKCRGHATADWQSGCGSGRDHKKCCAGGPPCNKSTVMGSVASMIKSLGNRMFFDDEADARLATAHAGQEALRKEAKRTEKAVATAAARDKKRREAEAAEAALAALAEKEARERAEAEAAADAAQAAFEAAEKARAEAEAEAAAEAESRRQAEEAVRRKEQAERNAQRRAAAAAAAAARAEKAKSEQAAADALRRVAAAAARAEKAKSEQVAADARAAAEAAEVFSKQCAADAAQAHVLELERKAAEAVAARALAQEEQLKLEHARLDMWSGAEDILRSALAGKRAMPATDSLTSAPQVAMSGIPVDLTAPLLDPPVTASLQEAPMPAKPTAKAICRNFLSSAGCRHGDSCRYSHEGTESVLQPSTPVRERQASAKSARAVPEVVVSPATSQAAVPKPAARSPPSRQKKPVHIPVDSPTASQAAESRLAARSPPSRQKKTATSIPMPAALAPSAMVASPPSIPAHSPRTANSRRKKAAAPAAISSLAIEAPSKM